MLCFRQKLIKAKSLNNIFPSMPVGTPCPRYSGSDRATGDANNKAAWRDVALQYRTGSQN